MYGYLNFKALNKQKIQTGFHTSFLNSSLNNNNFALGKINTTLQKKNKEFQLIWF